MAGKLFGIGVGPGDPGLLTVKAVDVLHNVKHVFAPVAKIGKESLAFEIARGFIPDKIPVTRLLFPMTKDTTVVEQYWMENYQKIEKVVRNDGNAAFLTLGDPCIYSTFSVILRLFKEYAPDITVEIVSGITSFSHAAAKANISLIEGDEILCIIPGNHDNEKRKKIIDNSDTVIFLKTYKKDEELLYVLKEKGFLKDCIYIKRCGLDNEKIIHNIEDMPKSSEYLSLIVLKKSQHT